MSSFVLSNPYPKLWDHTYSILTANIEANEPSPEQMHRFDEIICGFLMEQGIPGAALHITDNGKPIYSQGYGVSRCGERVTSSSHFRIASISKVFTAVAVVKLCHEKQCPLSTKVFGEMGVLPEFSCTRPVHQEITIKHLLQHSAGWDRDVEGDHVFWYQDPKHPLNPWDSETLLQYILKTKLSFPPGERHAYSNLGYLVLGLIVEQLSGVSYEDYIHHILTPLLVSDVTVGNTDCSTVHSTEVQYFNNKEPAIERSILPCQKSSVPQYGSFPMETTGSYGGLVTSTSNLTLLLDSLDFKPGVPEILPRHLVKVMMEKPIFEKGNCWYGCGLDIEDDGESFGHTGAMEGTSATARCDQSGLSWALLLNAWAKDMDLDGLVKFALSTVPSMPFWLGSDIQNHSGVYFVSSEDGREFVTVLIPRLDLLSHVLEMKEKGYVIKHINALSLTDDVKFIIIWLKKQPSSWHFLMDVKVSDFNEQLTQLRQNWSVKALEVYIVSNLVFFLFVLHPLSRSVEQKVYAVSNVDEHRTCAKLFLEHGFIQKSQSTVKQKKIYIIACVFEREKETSTSKRRNSKNIPEQWLELPIQNYVEDLQIKIENYGRLEYLQFYTTDDMPEISAVWKTSTSILNVFQRHDVTLYGFLFELRESMIHNRYVLFVSAYEYEGVVYFSTIWSCSTRTRKRTRQLISAAKCKRKPFQHKQRVTTSAGDNHYSNDSPEVIIDNVEDEKPTLDLKPALAGLDNTSENSIKPDIYSTRGQPRSVLGTPPMYSRLKRDQKRSCKRFCNVSDDGTQKEESVTVKVEYADDEYEPYEYEIPLNVDMFKGNIKEDPKDTDHEFGTDIQNSSIAWKTKQSDIYIKSEPIDIEYDLHVATENPKDQPLRDIIDSESHIKVEPMELEYEIAIENPCEMFGDVNKSEYQIKEEPDDFGYELHVAIVNPDVNLRGDIYKSKNEFIIEKAEVARKPNQREMLGDIIDSTYPIKNESEDFDYKIKDEHPDAN
ncbi:uncharacterized protein LOC128238990 [Mya arenaria]|uniref:uncharacterized protein LOC128238990 n=1 Tax=Mya arenaria TaxID=6604 RepID=UPI0022E98C08|nr:uncharacterized protein LOC128238990 [Mya arenaria]XP_052811342.1 uncharacterized protein LOC128238990 [Mya arenaria]XP_052811343.1 uncharacterized protein LOC128238990 [Mya arenaria]XP_052811344.1 uncharacterized protein LOC128238990 [Mya arenaria]